jgi:dolichol-phosphate mannosyltransferase
MDGPDRYRRVRLSLVLPAFNEEAGIRQAVQEADEALAALCDDYEVLVVDDGSSDGTAQAVQAESAVRPRVRLLAHGSNRGYGAALRTGFTAARFELVAFTDADCQFYLEDLGKLLPLAEQNDVAVGYRIGRQDPWRRRVLSGGFNLMVRALLGTGVSDCDCALKVFRREALAHLLPETDGFFVNAEMLARARQQGFSVAEAGVRHRARVRGVSKVSILQVPRVLRTLLPFWWTRVAFPGQRAAACSRPFASSPGPAMLLLLLVAGLLFFTKLRAPLLEPQEPRYAEIPRQMLQQGSFVVPVLHGEPYLDKPPLLYWLIMGSYTLFGVSDGAARLVPGLAGVLSVLLTYLWGRRAVGERAGFCGALVLCLCPGFIYRERMLTFDSVLCLCVLAALAAAWASLTSNRWRRTWWVISAIACGLGLLTKGPVAFVLVAGPVLVFRFVDPRSAKFGWRDGSLYLAVAGLVAFPWYVAISLREPQFALSFFWTHNVMRFVQPFDHEEPFWFYVPGLLFGLLPWALFLPGFARFLARKDLSAALSRSPALGFCLLSAGWTVFFFSAAGCKRAVYLLPAMPPLALAFGCYLDFLLPRGLPTFEALRQRGVTIASRATLAVLALALAVVSVAVVKGVLRPLPATGFVAVSLIGMIYLMWRRPGISWAVCLATTFAVLYMGVRELQPAYNRQFALRSDLRRHVAMMHDRPAAVACYPQGWDSVTFYLPRADVKVYHTDERSRLLADLRARPETLLLVKSGRILKDLLDDLPDSVEYVTRGRQGTVTIGRVRARGPAPISGFAQLDPRRP